MRRELTTGMRETGINNMEWIDDEEWRREIKTRENIDNYFIIIYNIY